MLYFCYFFVNNDEEMKKLFYEINKDSYKNQQYVVLDDFKLNLYDWPDRSLGLRSGQLHEKHPERMSYHGKLSNGSSRYDNTGVPSSRVDGKTRYCPTS